MGSKEVQHVVSIEGEIMEQSNETPNDQFKSNIFKSLANRWLTFIKKVFLTKGKAILLLSLLAVILDPLFFYIPVVKNASTCLGLDNNLRIIVVVFRSFVDVLHTILWWQYSSHLVQGRYHLILAKTVAILAILPLPQVTIYSVPWQWHTLRLLKFTVLFQFFLRLSRIFPAYKDATTTDLSTPAELLINTWFAAAFNLVLYTLASNVLGAFWYLRAIERNMDCWREVCHDNQTLCAGSSLYCDDTSSYDGYLHKHCSKPPDSSTKSFDYGLYNEAFQPNIIETSTRFINKFFQCFWWGLRNLSSVGNLQTSNYVWDNIFAISIAILGLVLFGLLIGNMQLHLQTIWGQQTHEHGLRREAYERMKQRNINLRLWSPFSLLPPNLKEEVLRCNDSKWQEVTEVNLESLLNNTPTELKKKLKPHLCKNIFAKIQEFDKLRKQPRDELCALAKPRVCPEGSYICREGDLIYEVVFVIRGDLLSYSKHSPQTRVPVKHLSDGCFFGEELLQQLKQVGQQQQQAPDGSSLELPIASETIQATTKVEAFALSAKDLNKLFARYRGCLYEGQMDDTWAAFTTQAAWQKRGKARHEEKRQ